MRANNISKSLQSVCFDSDMFLLHPTSEGLQVHSRMTEIIWIKMLIGQKTIETPLFEKTELGGYAPLEESVL